MVELVVVILLVGVLAAVAASRLVSSTLFSHQASADELAGVLRHAHKRAISARAPVYVNLDAAARSVAFCLDAAPACAQPVTSPGSNAPLTWNAPADVTMSVAPAGTTQWSFDALGRVQGVAADTTTITLASTQANATIRTWAQTGFTEMAWTPL